MYEFKMSDLDKRICDIVEGATNMQTLREFIRESEKEFEMEPKNFDNMGESILDDIALNHYIEFLDYLWTK